MTQLYTKLAPHLSTWYTILFWCSAWW